MSCNSIQRDSNSSLAKYDIKFGNCSARTHPIKSNSTADFQACDHNTAGIAPEVEACMEKNGWSKLQTVECKGQLKFSHDDIQYCKRLATINEKISHLKMNDCLDGKTAKVRTDREFRDEEKELKRSLVSKLNEANKHATKSELNYVFLKPTGFSKSRKDYSLKMISTIEAFSGLTEGFSVVDLIYISRYRECWKIKRASGSEQWYWVRTGGTAEVKAMSNTNLCKQLP